MLDCPDQVVPQIYFADEGSMLQICAYMFAVCNYCHREIWSH